MFLIFKFAFPNFLILIAQFRHLNMKKSLILTENKEIFDKIKFRTKFEVTHAVWNPKISLIALGSRDGEVVVKRYLWKTGWKRNFSRDEPAKQFFDFGHADLSSSSSSDRPSSSSSMEKDQLLFLCWCPDGQVLLAVFQTGFCYFLDTQTGDTLFVKKLAYTAPFCVQWLTLCCPPTTTIGTMNNFPRAGDQPLALISSTNFAVNVEKGMMSNNNVKHQNVCCAVQHFYRNILPNSLTNSFLCILHCSASTSAAAGADTFVDIFAAGILLIRRLTVGHAIVCRHSLAKRHNEFFVYDNKMHILSKKEDESSDDGDADASADILQLPGEIGTDHLLVYAQLVDCFCWMSFCGIYLQQQQQQQNCSVAASAADGASAVVLDENGEEILRCATTTTTTTSFSFCKAMLNSVHLVRSLLVKLAELNGGGGGREGRLIVERLLDTLLKIAADHPTFDPHEILDENWRQNLDVRECLRVFWTLSSEGILPFVRQPSATEGQCVALCSDAKQVVMQHILGRPLQQRAAADDERRKTADDGGTIMTTDDEEEGGEEGEEEEMSEDENGGGVEGRKSEKTFHHPPPKCLHSFIFGCHSEQKMMPRTPTTTTKTKKTTTMMKTEKGGEDDEEEERMECE